MAASRRSRARVSSRSGKAASRALVEKGAKRVVRKRNRFHVSRRDADSRKGCFREDTYLSMNTDLARKPIRTVYVVGLSRFGRPALFASPAPLSRQRAIAAAANRTKPSFGEANCGDERAFSGTG
jgi:hypothetical protein